MTPIFPSCSMRGLIVALAACAAFGGGVADTAAATPYESKMTGGAFGYNQRQLEANRWLVKFAGDSDTPRQTVETYLLYRAAELTLKKGGDWFETSQSQTESKAGPPDHFKTSAYAGLNVGSTWSPHFRFFQAGPPPTGRMGPPPSTPDHGAGVSPALGYVASTEIVMGKGPPPTDRQVLLAREVLARLGPSIVRPPADKSPQD